MARILIVDDDPVVVSLASARLRREGHEVHAAGDGATGPMVAVSWRPDLIVLDFHMPAADGLKVYERLRGNTFTMSTPIIFMTAAPLGKVALGLREDAGIRLLRKPMDCDELAATVAELLPARPGRASPIA